MGIINVETPDGIKRVEIVGDKPTTEEQNAIANTFFAQQTPENEIPLGDIDISNMSNDELTQYFTARGRRERGQQEIIGAEGQAQQPAYPSPTVEGEVDSIVFRTGFGSKDTETERMEYIEEKFGPNTAVKFGPEDYGINLDNVEASIKEDYNLESSGTIRVNEPGFTKYDIPQFIGEYRGPLIATTLAAPFLAPLGFIAGVAATGAVAGLGKGVDEGIEYLEGTQRQTGAEVRGDMIKEALWMAAGEGILRPVFKVARRLFKGPGPKIEDTKRIDTLMEVAKSRGVTLSRSEATKIVQEEQRAGIKEIVRGGGKPTIEEATGKTVWGRIQAVYEAIIPNQAVLRSNQDYIKGLMKQYEKGSISQTDFLKAMNETSKRLTDDLQQAMKDPKTASKIANANLRNVIEKEVDILSDIIAKKEGAKLSKGLAEEYTIAVEDAHRLWKADNQSLYSLADDLIGNEAKFSMEPFEQLVSNTLKIRGQIGGDIVSKLSTSGSFQQLEKIVGQNLIYKAAIKQADAIKKAKEAGTPLIYQTGKLKGQPVELTVVEKQAIKQGERRLSYQELTSLRADLSSLKNDQTLNQSFLGPELQKYTKAINETLNREETRLLSYRSGSGIPMPGKRGLVSQEVAKRNLDGLDMLREANKHYEEGLAIFREGAIKQLQTLEKEGFAKDLSTIAQTVIQPKKPELLNNYLKAVVLPEAGSILSKEAQKLTRPVIDDLSNAITNKNYSGFNDILAANNIKIIEPFDSKLFNPKSMQSSNFQSIVESQLEKVMAFSRDVELRASNDARKNVARLLGNTWMKEAVDTSRTTGKFDIIKFAEKYEALGKPIQKTLFGKNTKELDNIMNNAFLYKKSDEVLINALNKNQIGFTTVREKVKNLEDAIKQADEIGENAVLNSIRSRSITDGDALLTGILNKPESLAGVIKSLEDAAIAGRNLSAPEIATIKNQVKNTVFDAQEGLKDIAMTRLLKNSFPDGTMTVESIASGSFGQNMGKALNAMNKNDGLALVLGNGNLATGKGIIKNLEKLADQSLRVSNRSFKGKAGLAPSTFVLGAAAAFFASPLSLLGSVGIMVAFSRILRNPAFLKWMTSSQASARIAIKGRQLGVNTGDGYFTRDMFPPEILDLMNREIRNTTMRGTSETAENLYNFGAEQFSNIAGNPQVQEATQSITDTVMGSPAGEFIQENVTDTDSDGSLANRARTALRDVEINKVLGIQ